MVFRYVSPRHPMHQLRREMDRLLSGVLSNVGDVPWPLASRARPAVNVWETDDALKVELELPGVKGDQVELFYAQSWSLVSLIAEQHGMPGLRRFIARSIGSDDVAANLRAALAVDPESFLAEWREHAYAAGVPDDLVPLARRFDPERCSE